MLLRIFTEPQQGASYDQLLAVAQTAETLGFDGFFRSDHYLAMGGGDGLPGPTDAWVTLAGIARETDRIRLGTLVTPATFRLPGPLAVSVAGVDAMSGGRVELGLGAGWFDAEHTAYGIPFPPVGERFERLTEQLAIITGLWATPIDQRFSFSGRHYRIEDSPALPKPVQVPGPPVIIGGGGPTVTPRLAARYGSEFNLAFRSLGDTGQQFDRVRAACEAADRDPGSMVFSAAQVVCCGRDDAEIARRAHAIGHEVSELRQNGLCGTPDQVVSKLATFAGAGATRAYLQMLDLDDLDHLALIAEEVLPRCAGL
jgi:F420-dependent oxidoreductase-like protein